MKKLCTLVLIAASYGPYAYSENTPAQGQLVLSCVETKADADQPGLAFLIAVNKDGTDAFVNTKTLRKRGDKTEPEWKVLASKFEVKSTPDNATPENFSAVQYHAPVNWDEENSCFVLQKVAVFIVNASDNGSYTGQVTLGGRILIDPSDENCSHPDLQQAQPSEIRCERY